MTKITKVFIERFRKAPLETLKAMSEDEIATLLQKANYSYYNSDTPLFSDNLFDLTKDYMETLNPNHPILKFVGSTAASGKKQELPYYMGSLDKIKADEKALDKYKHDYKGAYMVSDKLDGNSAMIHSKNGVVKLYSRGDGNIGQDITHLIPFIRNIAEIEITKEITIRGELIISKDDFETVKHKGANARNMVAGLMNSKIPDLEIAKLTQFVAYELITPKHEPEKQYKFIRALGFKVVYNQKIPENKLSIEELSKILVDRRSKSEFEIDGIVVFHNAIHKRMKNENPRYAFAFKSVITMQKAEVIVTNVEWNMSKDGYLIPVINFNGVSLAGVTIKRAHGFNGKFIQDNKIGPGSRIMIMRSGDVIPYVSEIISASETGSPQMPEGMKYTWTDTGVDIKLSATDEVFSDELRFKNLAYFFDKIDVRGLSSGNLRKMYDAGFTSAKGIFTASVSDLMKVEGFKTKMAEKIAQALADRKKTLDCITVMDASNALGRGIGKKKIELIIENIPAIIKTRHIPSVAEMLEIKGIEAKTANLFISNLPKYFEFVDKNELECIFEGGVNAGVDAGVSITEYYTTQNVAVVKGPSGKGVEFSPKAKGNSLQNKKYVFTGFRNDRLEKAIKTLGGTVSSSVSKSTTTVIRKDGNDKDSTKVKKAEELGIEVINLADFLKDHGIKL